MQKHQATLSSFQFRRATANVIHVFNEDSYLMAEYSERTGAVSWQRVLLATQREIIEKWLRERFPVQVEAAPERPAPRAKAASARRPTTRTAVAHKVRHKKRVAR
jgi:hypothetical protein